MVGLKDMAKLEILDFSKVFSKAIVCEQFMSVYELFASIALSCKQMTLMKFMNNQINKETNTIHELFINMYAYCIPTANPAYLWWCS